MRADPRAGFSRVGAKNQPWGLARGLAFELSMLFFILSFVSAYLLLQSALPSAFSLSFASACFSSVYPLLLLLFLTILPPRAHNVGRKT
jgi:uncharacterized membrane protein YhdT